MQAAWDEPKILIVTPTRGVMAFYRPHYASKINLHDGSCIPDSESARINAAFLDTVERCHSAGWRYHFTEERELKNARICDGKLRLGKMVYEKILIPNGCRFDFDEKKLVAEMEKLGMLIPAPTDIEHISDERCACTMTPEQSEWTLTFPNENQLLIEWSADRCGKLSASVEMKNVGSALTLVFSDPIEALQVNAKQTASEDKQTFLLSDLSDVLRLEVTPTKSEKLPFAWLKGDFAVFAVNGWGEFDARQVTCGSEFTIEGSETAKKLSAGELVSQGLPFFGGLLTAKKRFVLNEAYDGALTFDGLDVAAAKVTVDGKTLGWWWKEHPLHVSLTEGEHTVSVEAAPSTYNTYGPHHYYLGDCRLTSPDTFFGRGGYTDNSDAPANTFVDSMQFVKFTVDGNIVLRGRHEKTE